ncbi:helix-turn-helix domain-containing protein [Sulfurospirillum cavolei]|uniref:helix-turn-helix domain-containing protein n=1 Tax=Sulfurospirillum cavolei TaxID=366522 RepID=UPI0009DF7F59|nr:helix-turn-helix domain-containing protein [Sulfurospirillum cavolei]
MLKKGEIKMIKKFLAEGFSKSAIARKLGISRETVRRYAKFTSQKSKKRATFLQSFF